MPRNTDLGEAKRHLDVERFHEDLEHRSQVIQDFRAGCSVQRPLEQRKVTNHTIQVLLIHWLVTSSRQTRKSRTFV